MKLKTYNAIIKSIRSYSGLSRDCAKMLRKKYPNISPYTLYSILSLDVQQKMKFNHVKIFNPNKDHYGKYLEAVKNREPTGILLQMSIDIGVSPALLARHILEKHYVAQKLNVSRNNITKLFRDTTLIEDRDLAYEVYLCILYDDQYGPIADAIGLSVGQEYEIKLKHCISERKIAFHDEEHLRLRGYDKTPDIKLEVPIAVNGFVINWIESKARFGNVEIHEKYIKEQFLSYWNRFGPGLVIYWFGFLDTLSQPSEKTFIIMDHFPEDITYMDPGSIKPISLSL